MRAPVSAGAVSIRERPILFSGPMVRAILGGRKTQTRRVITEINPAYVERHKADDHWGAECRHGNVGDRLWVRESYRYFHESGWHDGDLEDYLVDQEHARPEADLRVGMRRDNERGGLVERVTYLHETTAIEDDHNLRHYRRRPSIHMPRWASRLTLDITGVRVERVQDISEADAIAEGCFDEKEHDGSLPSEVFRALWDSLNAPRGYSWTANPWVWVVEFTPSARERGA
jgi:hypothetical protein